MGKCSEEFIFYLHNGDDKTATFTLSDSEAWPNFSIMGLSGLKTLKPGESIPVKVKFNPYYSTGSLEGYIKAEGNGYYAEANLYGESIRGTAKNSPIHNLLLMLFNRILLLNNLVFMG